MSTALAGSGGITGVGDVVCAAVKDGTLVRAHHPTGTRARAPGPIRPGSRVPRSKSLPQRFLCLHARRLRPPALCHRPRSVAVCVSRAADMLPVGRNVFVDGSSTVRRWRCSPQRNRNCRNSCPFAAPCGQNHSVGSNVRLCHTRRNVIDPVGLNVEQPGYRARRWPTGRGPRLPQTTPDRSSGPLRWTAPGTIIPLGLKASLTGS